MRTRIKVAFNDIGCAANPILPDPMPALSQMEKFHI